MKRRESVGSIIWKTAKGQKLLVLGILLGVIGAILLGLLPPLILGTVIDRMAGGLAIPVSFLCCYFAATALTGMAESLREGFLILFGQRITHALRSALMDKYSRLTADELTRQEPGAVVSRFVADVDTVEKLFSAGVVSMLTDACKIGSILVVIWLQNRGLALLLLVLLPMVFWFTRVVQKSMLAAQLANRQALSRASGHVPETLRNIRTIHNLSKEAYMEVRYDQAIESSYRAVEKTNFYDAVYSPVILILNAVTVAVVMLLSASGRAEILSLFGMSAGTAVAVMNYIGQIFAPVESLGMEIQTIQSAVAGVQRINGFFNQEELSEKKEESCEKEDCEECSSLVEFRKVSFAYQERAVLSQLFFQIKQGEQVTFCGRTGAGKSTIFKLLLGLYEPDEGSVRIKGRAPSQIPEQEKRVLFGYVEQTFHPVPGSIKEQITLFDPSITMEAVREAAQTVGLETAILGLEQGYDTPCSPEIFSQGQWQLLSIARAAAAKPELFLLDEITANLDAQTQGEVLEALQRVSENRTVISISHRAQAETGRVLEVG